MSSDTDRLMNNARSRVPGATDTVLKQELFNVMNDFFQTSNIWQEDVAFAVNTTDKTYTITPAESYAAIVRSLYVLNSGGLPVGPYQMLTPGTIVFKDVQSQAGTYTATVSLTVDDPLAGDGFPQFPAWVLNKYSTGIIDGLVGRVMSQPAKPYTNIQLAAVHLRSFRSCMSDAKTEALHKNVNNGQTWRFPKF
ncbi:hypothetical protein CWO91_16550 [Bradyrhizobium genosp. SA-3]|nr:hypothetical protein CWO91_16550 [Bradyrhizobium genosp. SA-3]